MDCGFYIQEVEGLFNKTCSRRGMFYFRPLDLEWTVRIDPRKGTESVGRLQCSGRWRHDRKTRKLVRVRELSAVVHQKRNRGHGEQEGVNANSPRASSRSGMTRRGPTFRDGGRRLLQEFVGIKRSIDSTKNRKEKLDDFA